MWFTSVLMSMFFSTPRYEIQLSRRQLFPCSNVWLHVRPSIPPSVWIICCRLLFNNLSIFFVYANINYDNAFLAFPHSFEKTEEIQTFVWTDGLKFVDCFELRHIFQFDLSANKWCMFVWLVWMIQPYKPLDRVFVLQQKWGALKAGKMFWWSTFCAFTSNWNWNEWHCDEMTKMICSAAEFAELHWCFFFHIEWCIIAECN